MDETATRRKKIDPKLYAVGWEQVPQSVILTEQRAYVFAPGQVNRIPANRHPKKADYVLEYKGRKLAVIEAKPDEKDVSEGVEQAKLYASLLQIRFTYATNGDKIYAIDMGVRDASGQYIIPSTERFVDRFPSPQELWQMTYPGEDLWRDRFVLMPFNRDGGRTPRYYQENAINNVLSAVAKKHDRILLTMATGTGKTYTAFQICWKLFQTGWNKDGTDGRKPRILFISDRNILANQAVNDFDAFPSDAIERITPKKLRANHYRVPMSRHLYFTIFQTLMTSPKAQKEDEEGLTPNASPVERGTEGMEEAPYFFQYPKDFFDFIIIDECHRGGANDESEWRRLMDYFGSAYQLGMTATPKRVVNANTYRYFGEPVYSYSLKQGIEDGFLTPFRVKVATSNIDDYRYDPDDDIEGDIDKDKTYTEQDFYLGRIELRERDEHRVKELLQEMESPDDKTIVFCSKQTHAMVVRDMINQHKRVPDSNYCERVTANDGDDGEATLRRFQDNEKLRPTILTTSQKLSTGVDARNVRNIVLMRPINNMVEFKQIIGRGTRLFDDKYYFTIYDFVGASKRFQDDDWDGDPVCPVCGNYPCSCVAKKKRRIFDPYGDDDDYGEGGSESSVHEPEPCPVCGHLPCTCDGRGGVGRDTIVVRLSESRLLRLFTDWKEMIQYGDEMITLEDYIQRLFGRLPSFFESEEDLRRQWENPETRQALLGTLERSGFSEERLEMLRGILRMDKCDLLDVLEYIAYETSPMERERRVEIVKADYLQSLSKELQAFDMFVLDYYARNGYKELSMSNLATFLNLKYHGSLGDGIKALKMTTTEIQKHYLDLQHRLYNPTYSAATYINVNTDNLHVHGNYYNIHDNTVN